MIVAGTVSGKDDPKKVHKMHVLFGLYEYPNFRTNFFNLIEAVARDYDRLQLDLEAFGHDVELKKILRQKDPPPPPKYPNWHADD